MLLCDLIQAGCDMGGHFDCDMGRDTEWEKHSF